MSDRPEGILTTKQREYIRMSEDERMERFNSQERYRYRQRIRSRVENTLRDCRLLNQFAREDDTDALADAYPSADDDGRPPQASLTAAVELLTRVQDPDDDQIFVNSRVQPAFRDLYDAITKGVEGYAAEKKGAVVNLDVSIDVTSADPPEAILHELRTGDADDPDRLRKARLLERAGVDRDDLADVMSGGEVAEGETDAAPDE